jgi:hypothetical protein
MAALGKTRPTSTSCILIVQRDGRRATSSRKTSAQSWTFLSLSDIWWMAWLCKLFTLHRGDDFLPAEMGSPLCFWAADDVLFTYLTVWISNALCFEDLQVHSIFIEEPAGHNCMWLCWRCDSNWSGFWYRRMWQSEKKNKTEAGEDQTGKTWEPETGWKKNRQWRCRKLQATQAHRMEATQFNVGESDGVHFQILWINLCVQIANLKRCVRKSSSQHDRLQMN